MDANGPRHPPDRTVTAVVAARPNFVKMAPVVHALLRADGTSVRVLHTGQHYDRRCRQLPRAARHARARPRPRCRLGHARRADGRACWSASSASLREHPPDAVVVARRRQLDARRGARRGQARRADRAPRVGAALGRLDDARGDQPRRHRPDLRPAALPLRARPSTTWPPRASAVTRCALVGNTMIDTLFRLLPAADAGARRWLGSACSPAGYVLVTLHRPAIVDEPRAARARCSRCWASWPTSSPVVFPVHPRTRARAGDGQARHALGRMCSCVDPLDYLDFIALESVGAGSWSPTRAACRRRRRRSACPASRTAPHRASGDERARDQPARRRRPGGAARAARGSWPRSAPGQRRSRCGTVTPASVPRRRSRACSDRRSSAPPGRPGSVERAVHRSDPGRQPAGPVRDLERAGQRRQPGHRLWRVGGAGAVAGAVGSWIAGADAVRRHDRAGVDRCRHAGRRGLLRQPPARGRPGDPGQLPAARGRPGGDPDPGRRAPATAAGRCPGSWPRRQRLDPGGGARARDVPGLDHPQPAAGHAPVRPLQRAAGAPAAHLCRRRADPARRAGPRRVQRSALRPRSARS